MGNEPSSPPPKPLPLFPRKRSPWIKIGVTIEFGFCYKAMMMDRSSEGLEHPKMMKRELSEESEYPESDKLLVLAFLASSNEACQGVEPILNEFAAKYKDVDFFKMDVDMIDDAAQRYGIQTTPTFVLRKDGIEVDKLVGADREELMRKIENHK